LHSSEKRQQQLARLQPSPLKMMDDVPHGVPKPAVKM